MTQTNTPTKPRVSPLLVIFMASGFLGMLAAVVMLIAEQQTDTPTAESLTRTRPVEREWRADDFELMSLEGEPVRLSDFAGRTVFINFWRTDCPPCVAELPDFQQFMVEQGDSGAVVLAINQGERADDIARFLNEINVAGIPVLLDEDLAIDDSFPVGGLPTTYVVDGEGLVRYTKIGAMTLDEMYVYLDEVG